MAERLALIDDRIGKTLRRWRRVNGVKQTALADDLGVSQATISRWEAGSVLPDDRELCGLLPLVQANPSSPSDRILIDLVETSREPVHLVCDLTHTLLALSRARQAEWRIPASELGPRSLWKFATQGIRRAEHSLQRLGWHDQPSAVHRFKTEALACDEVAICECTVVWTRIPLANGSFARLVSNTPAGAE